MPCKNPKCKCSRKKLSSQLKWERYHLKELLRRSVPALQEAAQALSKSPETLLEEEVKEMVWEILCEELSDLKGEALEEIRRTFEEDYDFVCGLLSSHLTPTS